MAIKKPEELEQYTNLAGISDASKNNLNYYSQGYQPSQRVTDAQNYLQQVIDKQPGAFQSKYENDIQSLYDKVLNRQGFSYNPNTDPLYQQYKHHYTTQGQQAMRDTVGNAAALTGGYGNSWAATAGSQAYQQYLQQLNDVLPQLENQAYNRYAQEGNDLRQNLATAQGLRDTEYGQYRDTVGDWQTDRNFAYQQYGDDYQRDYNQWMQFLQYWQNMAQAENENFWNQQNFDFALRQYEDAMAKKGSGSSWTPKKQTAGNGTKIDMSRLGTPEESGWETTSIPTVMYTSEGVMNLGSVPTTNATANNNGKSITQQKTQQLMQDIAADPTKAKQILSAALEKEKKKNTNSIDGAVNSILKGTP